MRPVTRSTLANIWKCGASHRFQSDAVDYSTVKPIWGAVHNNDGMLIWEWKLHCRSYNLPTELQFMCRYCFNDVTSARWQWHYEHQRLVFPDVQFTPAARHDKTVLSCGNMNMCIPMGAFIAHELQFGNCSSRKKTRTMRPSSLCLQPISRKWVDVNCTRCFGITGYTC